MKEKIWEGVYEGKAANVVVEPTASGTLYHIELLESGFLHDIIGGVTSFAKSHPWITGMMAGWAWSAIEKYNKAKRDAVQFYAKDMPERIRYEKMVNDLVRKGGYEVVKHGYEGTGYHWELYRRDR